MATKPEASSSLSASRTGIRLTPKRWASRASESFSPKGMTPEAISCRNCETMASFIDPLPTVMGAVGPGAAAADLGSDTTLASARTSELPKTVIRPFVGARSALERGRLRSPPATILITARARG